MAPDVTPVLAKATLLVILAPLALPLLAWWASSRWFELTWLLLAFALLVWTAR